MRSRGSLSMPMLKAIFMLALFIFGPVGLRPIPDADHSRTKRRRRITAWISSNAGEN